MKSFYNEFRKPIIYIILILVGFFLYTKIAGPLLFYINSVQTNKNDLFTVDGTGKTTAIPDMATISIGITENDTTVIKVQEKINQVSNKIIDAVKKLGVEEKYIETINYNIYPDYGNTRMIINDLGNTNRQSIVGYNATQNLEIKIKDIEKINKVIDTATAMGANLIGNVNFTFSDELRNKLEEKARIEAVGKAKEKARSLAKVSGIRLGKLINVYESSYDPFRVTPLGLGGSEKTDSSLPTNITPGEKSVNITITLNYEIN